MLAKLRFILLVLTCFLLTACSSGKADTAELYYIKWYAMPYAETPSGYFGESLPETVYRDADLSARVKDADLLPLDSNERITQYAYLLREALVADGFLPTTALPQSAQHYADGFWVLIYELPDQSDGEDSTIDKNWCFLVSDSDGAVNKYNVESSP